MPGGTLVHMRDYRGLGIYNGEGRPLFEILREIDLEADGLSRSGS